MKRALAAAIRLLSVFLLALLVAAPAVAAPGSLLGVTITPFPGGDSGAKAVVMQSDGKPVVVGWATVGAYQFALTRFNIDGSLDTTYGANHNGTQLQSLSFNDSYANAAALQGDGKVVAVGAALTDSGTSRLALARFNTDGTLDTSLGGPGAVVMSIGPADSGASAVAIQSDGRIVVGGWSRGPTGKQVFMVARFNTDGTLDAGFGNQGVVAFAEGSGNETITSLMILGDGGILVAGNNSTTYSRYAKLTSTGALDSTFAGGSATITSFYVSSHWSRQADGKFLIGGSNGNGQLAAARLNLDGSLDSTFGAGGVGAMNSLGGSPACTGLVPLADGHILCSGLFYHITAPQVFTSRFNADGSYDSSYGEKAVAFGAAVDIAARPGGGYIIPGWDSVQSAHVTVAVAIDANGALDPTFNGSGIERLGLGADAASAAASAMQADGKIVVAGTDVARANSKVVRYNVDGSLDTTFGSSGIATVAIASTNALAIQPDGKLVIAGSAFGRLNADGSMDSSFGAGGNGIVAAPANTTIFGLAIQGDGGIVAAGRNSASGFHSTFVRLLSSGALDNTFGTSGSVVFNLGSSGDELDAVALQSDGKIVGSGWVRPSSSQQAMSVIRVNADGTLDAGFGSGGAAAVSFALPYATAAALVIQPDGNIVAGGSVSTVSYDYRDFALARLTPAGALDNTFGNGGLVQTQLGTDDLVLALALLADGKIVAAGSSGPLVALAQYLPNGALDTSFGGGGFITREISNNAKPGWKDTAIGLSIGSDGTLYAGATASAMFALARFAGEGAAGSFTMASVTASSTPNPSITGQFITMTVTVTGSAGTPTGFVDFVLDGGNALQPCTRIGLAGGNAQCSSNQVSVGSHTITAVYSGDATYSSASFSFGQVVNKGDPSISVTVSENPLSPGTPVLFYATVSGNLASKPSGSATFLDGGNPIPGCTSMPVSTQGLATCTTSTLTATGPHAITVAYSGDASYNSATSAPFTETVQGIGANDTNWALASNGGAASASSQYGPSFPITAVNNGDRTGANWSNGGGWANGPESQYPPTPWTEIDFSAPKLIDTVVVYTLQDNYQNPVDPTDTMTFTQWGVTAFKVQGWNGSAWQTLATVSGNNLVKRRVAINPFNTSKIRVVFTSFPNGAARVTEIEAWGVAGSATTTAIDMALQGNGGVAFASSQIGNGYPVSAINNGERAGSKWTQGGGWADGTVNQWPDWVEVDFDRPASLTSVVLYTVQDNWQSPVEPTDTMTFTQYGITDFNVQGWDGSQWVTLGTVSGNNLVKRTVNFSAFVTSKIRVNVTGALASLSRITEVEAWGVPQSSTPTQKNVALASTGATVTASSQYSANYPVTALNDNERAGINWSAGGGWADGTANQFPDWVEVDFLGQQTIDHVVVYTVQDNWQNPVEPTDTMTFTQYGITDFTVQAWDGTQWVTVGTVSGNNLVKRTVPFAAFTTNKIRINVTNALSSLSRITEVEAWGVRVPPTPPQYNWALASNNAIVFASGQYDANYSSAAAIDGDTAGTHWSQGGGWADGSLNQWPDWLEVDLQYPRTLDHVILYTVQDNWQNPSTPTDTMMFTQYGITDFEVQGWNGSQWVTLGAVNNNYFVKRTVAFAPFTTGRIRVVVTRSLGGLSRITELQAWGN